MDKWNNLPVTMTALSGVVLGQVKLGARSGKAPLQEHQQARPHSDER